MYGSTHKKGIKLQKTIKLEVHANTQRRLYANIHAVEWISNFS